VVDPPEQHALSESRLVADDHRPPRRRPHALDGDTLIVADEDLRIMVYTAEPGTEDAERLGLAIVLGTQSLVD
jgi:hypothetical protein